MDENEINCDDKDPENISDKEEDDIQEQDDGQETVPRGYAIWKFFKRMSPTSGKRARCILCLEVRSFRTSITNLKTHLKRHPKAYAKFLKLQKQNERPKRNSNANEETDFEDTGRKPRYRDSTVWKYFEIMSESDKMAKCNFCNQVRSYKTTVTNLKKHLSMKHPEVTEQDVSLVRKIFPSYRNKESQSRKTSRRCKKKKLWEILQVESDNDEAQNETNDTGNIKFSSEIWRHFVVDEDEAACCLCRETVARSLEDMKNHLEERHATVLDDIAQKVLDAASEDENVLGEDEMFTEVVYLEDEMKKADEKPVKPKKPKIQPKCPKVKIERLSSTSSDEFVQKPKLKNFSRKSIEPIYEANIDNELKSFINYITVLLKKVPSESSQKLHLDIINLIMNTTRQSKVTENVIHNVSSENNVSVEKSVSLQQNVNEISNDTVTSQKVLTVPLQNVEISNASQVTGNANGTRMINEPRSSVLIPDIRVYTNIN